MRIRKTGASQDPGGQARTGPDAAQAMTALYQAHYQSMVRLAVLLVSDQAVAEDIVQDCFAATYSAWATLPGVDAALSYLRRSVVRRSRSAPQVPAGQNPQAAPPLPGAADVLALRALPARRREVLVLRYFADLPEAEIASVTGIRTAAVRSYAARAMSSLRAGLPLAE